MSFPINTPMPDWRTITDAVSEVPGAVGDLSSFLMGQSRPGYSGPQQNIPLGQGQQPTPDLVNNPWVSYLLGQSRPGYTDGMPDNPTQPQPSPLAGVPVLNTILGMNRPGYDDVGNQIQPPASMFGETILPMIEAAAKRNTQHPTDRGAVRAGDSGQTPTPTGDTRNVFQKTDDAIDDYRTGSWTRKLSAAERRAGMNDPQATAEIIIAKNQVDPNSQAASIFRENMQAEAVEWLQDQRVTRERAGLKGYPAIEELYRYLNGFLVGLLDDPQPVDDYGPQRTSPQITPKNEQGGRKR